MSPGETCVVCGSPDIQLASFSMETQLWRHWCGSHLPEYVVGDMFPMSHKETPGEHSME